MASAVSQERATAGKISSAQVFNVAETGAEHMICMYENAARRGKYIHVPWYKLNGQCSVVDGNGDAACCRTGGAGSPVESFRYCVTFQHFAHYNMERNAFWNAGSTQGI